MSNADPFFDLRMLVDVANWRQISTFEANGLNRYTKKTIGETIAEQGPDAQLSLMTVGQFIEGSQRRMYSIWSFIEPDEYQYQLEQLPPMNWVHGESAALGTWEGFQCCEGQSVGFHATYIAAQHGHFCASRPAHFDYKKGLQELQEQGLVLA